MSKYCKQCGTQLDDDELFCTACGAKYEENESFSNADEVKNKKLEKPNKSKKKAVILGVIAICIIAIGALGYFVIYPQVTQYIQEQENQEKAERVINLINSVTSGEITLDSEKDLDSAKTEYNSLTDEQKSLVDNYNKLEEAYAALDGLKIEQENQEKAQSVIDAIESVDSASLTDSDTSVQTIRDQYDSLTDDQKKLVTNADKLTEYENIVQQKKEQKAEEEARAQSEQNNSNKIVEMFANFQEYDGLWGDFGSHVNSYQGMVESAIKSSISLSDYFGGDVNGVYMYLYKVVDNDDVLMNGANATNQHYIIRFEGLNPNGTGMYRTLECMVDSPDGVNLVYTEQSYY